MTPFPDAVQPVIVAVNVKVVAVSRLGGVTPPYPVGINQVPLLQGSVMDGLIWAKTVGRLETIPITNNVSRVRC